MGVNLGPSEVFLLQMTENQQRVRGSRVMKHHPTPHIFLALHKK
jgi:hypothetical protein